MQPRTVPKPNFTQTPNVFFDDWLKQIETAAELKVVLTVIRYTCGWHDAAAGLSLSDFQKLTGLGRSNLVEGIKKAIAHGFVERQEIETRRVYRIPIKGRPGFGLASLESRPGQGALPGTESEPGASLESELSPNGKKKKKKGQRKAGIEIALPDEMRTLTDEMLKAAEKAKAAGVDIVLEHEHFVSHADQHSLKYVSWAGAWRTWLVKAIKFKKERESQRPGGGVTVQSRPPLHEQLKERKP